MNDSLLSLQNLPCEAAVVGGGPAGLMAAEELARAGVAVHLFDAMPSIGRKFLLAGRGGLNLTHSESLDVFWQRYGGQEPVLRPMLQDVGPDQVRAWARSLGVETFVGTSGRVFPSDMKAAPLLRAWLQRLRSIGVRLHMRHRWIGWSADHGLVFEAPSGRVDVPAKSVVLALGGGSWARLGSDGAWAPVLREQGVKVAPLRPANCGFDVHARKAQTGETRREFFQDLLGNPPALPTGWSPHFVERYAGQPFKSIALSFNASDGRSFHRKGEFVATSTGVEGSLVYAVSALLRDEIEAHGSATFFLDLLPDHSAEHVLVQVRHPRGSRSLSSHLKSRLGIDGIKMGILYEQLRKDQLADPVALAHAIKALAVTVVATRPLDEAISTAGGVDFGELDSHLMLRSHPGIFCAGEMLDWEAPTGGYLLTACLSTGVRAGRGALLWLRAREEGPGSGSWG